jgi:hypothetical protein
MSTKLSKRFKTKSKKLFLRRNKAIKKNLTLRKSKNHADNRSYLTPLPALNAWNGFCDQFLRKAIFNRAKTKIFFRLPIIFGTEAKIETVSLRFFIFALDYNL